MVTVRFFASLKDLAKKNSITLKFKQSVPLNELLEELSRVLPEVGSVVREKHVLVAVNQREVGEDTLIRDGDEVAIMPPFSGGSLKPPPPGEAIPSIPWTRIQEENFSVEEEIARILACSKRIGGIAVFLGTARDFSEGRAVSRLTYEHYSGMAERILAEIREKAKAQFDIFEACLIHRIGDIPIGGNIVLVVTGAEHRAEAFRACRWCIDRLKTTAPIWKRETTAEGEVWVEVKP